MTFEEKAGRFLNAKWFVHFSTFFVITFIVAYVMLTGLTENKMNKAFIFSLGIATFIGLAFTILLYIGKEANTFFREADRIESMIREGAAVDVIIKDLYALKKKSFHRHTGDRLTQLAKMTEVKYNVSILKK